ncbi:MAG: minor curlin subunit [Colwellia sp.]|jgi:minor curlin subunit
MKSSSLINLFSIVACSCLLLAGNNANADDLSTNQDMLDDNNSASILSNDWFLVDNRSSLSQVTQLGNNNKSTVNQSGDNLAIVTQVGNGNLVDINQQGSDNLAVVTQVGDYNEIDINQIGQSNVAVGIQLGGQGFSIEQIGDNMNVVVTQMAGY